MGKSFLSDEVVGDQRFRDTIWLGFLAMSLANWGAVRQMFDQTFGMPGEN